MVGEMFFMVSKVPLNLFSFHSKLDMCLCLKEHIIDLICRDSMNMQYYDNTK